VCCLRVINRLSLVQYYCWQTSSSIYSAVYSNLLFYRHSNSILLISSDEHVPRSHHVTAQCVETGIIGSQTDSTCWVCRRDAGISRGGTRHRLSTTVLHSAPWCAVGRTRVASMFVGIIQRRTPCCSKRTRTVTESSAFRCTAAGAVPRTHCTCHRRRVQWESSLARTITLTSRGTRSVAVGITRCHITTTQCDRHYTTDLMANSFIVYFTMSCCPSDVRVVLNIAVISLTYWMTRRSRPTGYWTEEEQSTRLSRLSRRIIAAQNDSIQ